MELMEMLKGVPVPVLVLVILLLAVVTGYICYQYMKLKGLEGIRKDVYQLFLLAEHRYKESGTGKQKMKWVIQNARGLLPSWLQLVVTESALEKLAEKWFTGIKDLLDDGKVNQSTK